MFLVVSLAASYVLSPGTYRTNFAGDPFLGYFSLSNGRALEAPVALVHISIGLPSLTMVIATLYEMRKDFRNHNRELKVIFICWVSVDGISCFNTLYDQKLAQ
jgi:hypothetical protein